MATATRKRTTKKPEPVEEDLEEEEEDTEPEPAPKRTARKAPAKKAAAPAKPAKETLGTAWLREHVSDVLGTDVESTKLRIVLRKLIKDGTIESPKDGRYVFTGPRDPNVKAVLAALRAETKTGPAKRGRKPKAKVAAEVADDTEDEVEDLDLDDE